MAKINTTFGFKDQITQNLSLLNNTLTSMNKTLNTMQGQMRNGLNPAFDATNKKANEVASSVGGLNTKLLNFNSAVVAIRTVTGAFGKLKGEMDGMIAAYDVQAEAELKLETVMRNHMNATAEEIQSIKDLASAEQSAGIYGDEMILQGAQELATYVDNVDTLKGLIPVVNSMVAQSLGTKATANDILSYSTMVGKVMQGQVGGMSKRGYKFTEAEEEILKTGTEMQRLAILQKAVIGGFGDMNKALAQNTAGKIVQLKNAMGDLKETTGQLLKPLQQEMMLLKNKILVDFYAGMNKTLSKIIPVITRLVRAFQDIYDKVKPFIQKISDFIQDVLGKAINFVVNHLHDIIMAVSIVASVMMAKTIAMGASWAIVHWKILLIIAALVLLVKVLNFFGVGLEEIGAYVGGTFATAFVGVYNIVATLYNIWVSIYELIVNITKHPLQALANFLADIFATMYDALATITSLIDGIGAVIGKDWNISGVFKDVANNIRASKITDDMEIMDRMELMTGDKLAATVQKGMGMGASIGKGLDDAATMIKNAYKGLDSQDETVEEAIKNSFNFDGDGTLKTSEQNKLQISDDFKRALSEQALRDYQVNYSQITPSVTIETMDVSKDADADSIIQKIADAIRDMGASHLLGAA